jgi:tetratricopeptide (TPR) repeat protein
MSSSDAIRRSATDAGSNPSDRAALIEQLLLAGLDQYFSGDYEQAIHLWTRVFFLDRGHARARAYIERARGALAERQREAEAEAQALGLDEGSSVIATSTHVMPVSARTAGEPATARALVPRRLSRRDLLLGSSEVMIEDGIELEGSELTHSAALRSDPKDARGETPAGSRLLTHIVLVTLATVLLCGAAYLVVDRDRLATWWRMSSDPGTTAPILTAEPLPVPRASEQAFARARTLFERGRLHEAMQALTSIRTDDPLRRDADLLLADIERALLESAGVSLAPSTAPSTALSTSPPPSQSPLIAR